MGLDVELRVFLSGEVGRLADVGCHRGGGRMRWRCWHRGTPGVSAAERAPRGAASQAQISSPTTIVGDGTSASSTRGGFPISQLLAAASSMFHLWGRTGHHQRYLRGSGWQRHHHRRRRSGDSCWRGTSRILHIMSAWNLATPLLTVQNLSFVNGFTSDVPNTSSTARGGGAIFQDGGSLAVINSIFTHNQCASTGQDVSGGAINGQGVGTLTIVGSTFSDNSGSNGGAVGTQDEDVMIVNTTFANNSATGTDGNPGNGGDGGALSYDGANVSLAFCGDSFTGNRANAAGGAVFRVGYHDEEVNIDRCTFDGNSVDANSGNAAGLYLEYVTINMSGTTISNNTGHYGGGIWIGQSAIANLTNVTIANNTAAGGGGVWFANAVTGTLLNVTVAGNTGDGLFGGDTGVNLQNSIVANNLRGTLDGTTNCARMHGSSGPNLQFPSSATQCTSSITAADPALGPLQDNGGPTKTMLAGSGHRPAIGKGTGCPQIDQRGNPRASLFTLGAVETT